MFVSKEAMIAGQELAGFSHSIRPARYLSAIRCKNECCRSRHPYIHVELLAVFSRSTNYLTVQRDKNDIRQDRERLPNTRAIFHAPGSTIDHESYAVSVFGGRSRIEMPD